MRSTSAGEQPLEPGGDDDMVCGLDVCDELIEYSGTHTWTTAREIALTK